MRGLSLYSLDDHGVGLNVLGRRQYILLKSVGFLGLISLLERMGVKNSFAGAIAVLAKGRQNMQRVNLRGDKT